MYLNRYKRHKRLNPRRLFCIVLADKTHQKQIRLSRKGGVHGEVEREFTLRYITSPKSCHHLFPNCDLSLQPFKTFIGPFIEISCGHSRVIKRPKPCESELQKNVHKMMYNIYRTFILMQLCGLENRVCVSQNSPLITNHLTLQLVVFQDI